MHRKADVGNGRTPVTATIDRGQGVHQGSERFRESIEANSGLSEKWSFNGCCSHSLLSPIRPPPSILLVNKPRINMSLDLRFLLQKWSPSPAIRTR